MRDKENKIFSIEEVKYAKRLESQILALEKEQQSAILWIICRYEFMDLIDSGRIMTEEEEKEWMEKAVKDNDYMLMTLIEYKRQKDQDRVQKQKIPLDRG